MDKDTPIRAKKPTKKRLLLIKANEEHNSADITLNFLMDLYDKTKTN